MPITRDTRIFGMMLLFGLGVALICGHWKYAGHATWIAVGVGGFAGEAWHRWRVKSIGSGRHP